MSERLPGPAISREWATGRRAGWWFWGAAVALTLLCLGTDLHGSEARWGDVAQEMLRSGRWFRPAINGEAYFDKPLLSYWLIAALARLSGSVSEWSIRLPSVLEALAALAATRSLGRRLWGADVAESASWLLLASYGFLFWARRGEADMGNLAAIVLAVAWYWQRRERPVFATYAVFYLIIALGAHLKGLAALVLPPLVVMPDLLRSGRWRPLLSLSHLGAVLMGAGVFVAPYLAVLARTGGSGTAPADLFDTMVHENVVRYFAPFDHVEPFYVYLYYVPILLLPWAPLAIGSVGQAFRAGRRRALSWPSAWLGLACVTIFLFFTASGSRRDYYVLPLLPFACLWMALYLTERLGEPWQRNAVMTLERVIVAALASVEIAAGLAMPWVAGRLDLAPSLPLAVSFVVVGLAAWPFALGAAAGPLAAATRVPRDAAPLVLATTVMFAGYFGVQQPLMEVAYGNTRGFAERVLAARPPRARLAFYREADDRLVFYLNQPIPVPVLNGSADVTGNVTPSRPLMLLGRTTEIDALAAALPSRLRATERITRRGRADTTYDKDRAAVALVIAAEPTSR